jgi:ribosomal protein L40E
MKLFWLHRQIFLSHVISAAQFSHQDNVSPFTCASFEKLFTLFNCWLCIYLWWRLIFLSCCTPFDEVWYASTSINYIVIPQHLLLLIRCTHQSMPIVTTLSPELRVSVPTVGSIHQILAMYISIVMVINLNWVILTEAPIQSTQPLLIMCGLLVVMGNCCSYSPQESPWLPSHCTTTVTVTEAVPDYCIRWLWYLGCTKYKHTICRYCFSPTRWRASRSQECQHYSQLQYKESMDVQVQQQLPIYREWSGVLQMQK